MKIEKILYYILFLLILTPAIFAAEESAISYETVVIFGIIFLICLLIGLALFTHWVFMIVDCVQREFKTKLKWILLLVFLFPIANIFYHIIIKRKKVGNDNSKKPIETLALLSFIFSLVGFLLFFSFGLFLGIVGIIFSILSKKNLKQKKLQRGEELSKAGFVISIAAMALQVFFIIVYVCAVIFFIAAASVV